MPWAAAEAVSWAEAYCSRGVENDLGGPLATQGDRHLQGGLDQVCARVLLDRPADHTTRDGGQVEPAPPDPQIGDVADPHSVGDPVSQARPTASTG